MPIADGLLSDLLALTDCSRTTMRIVGVDGSAHLLAECRADADVPSMAGRSGGIDPRRFPTYTYLEERRELLIQNDTRTDPVSPPPDLIEVHRVHAQMLAPLIVAGDFVGTLSVHLIGRTRDWSEEQIDALRRCRAAIEEILRDAAGARLR